MTSQTHAQRQVRQNDRTAPPRRRRRRRRRRWIIAGSAIAAGLVALAAIAAVAVKPQPGAPPFALSASAAAPEGSADGRWSSGPESTAGFRVRQSSFGSNADVVGRTNRVTGGAVITDGRLTAAAFTMDLTMIQVNGKASPQFAASIGTGTYPDATFTLTAEQAGSAGINSGTITTAALTGQLTLHGVTRPVALAVSARRTGNELDVAGSMPVAFTDWGIKAPRNYGPLGSLADHGRAEFLLVLHRK
jgi:polyisoprenoid-binding protein YceI